VLRVDAEVVGALEVGSMVVVVLRVLYTGSSVGALEVGSMVVVVLRVLYLGSSV
jgi:hypothetical protein